MPSKTIITAAAGIVAATGIVVTVASLANASTSTSPTALTGYSLGYGQQSGEVRGDGGLQGGRGGSADTPVTGAELTKVTAAVEAKDSAVTVTSVRKDPDGSYDVFGTKAGAQVMLEVSKDLETITARTGGPGGHGPGGHGPDGDAAPDGTSGGAGTSGGTGAESNGTDSNGSAANGTASTTAFRTV